LETHSKTQHLLKAYLENFDCTSWQEYLKILLSLTGPIILNDREAHIDIKIEPGDSFEHRCAFIEKLMIYQNDEFDQNDFLTIRARPFYKINNGVYRIIF